MTKEEFIAKYEGWFSYTRREELKKQMESDLDAVFQALRQPLVSGSDSVKSCQNCKYYTADKNRCNHEYWNLCIKRDDEGYVKSYGYHHFR